MADPGDAGNKTEPATPKRLRDARRRGEIPKSRELTSLATLAFATVLFAFAAAPLSDRVAALLDAVLAFGPGAGDAAGFSLRLRQFGLESLQLFVLLSALVLMPVAIVGMLVEFLQAGAVFAPSKATPRLSHLDPAAGLRRMFSADNVVEMLKSVAKCATLLVIGGVVIHTIVAELVQLPGNDPAVLVPAVASLLLRLFGWTLGVFTVLALADLAWQRHAFAKRMRMSIREIREETKSTEGDPLIRGQRRQMHQQYASGGALEAASRASVLVVNPEHIAIAIAHDRDREPVPRIRAIGEDALALEMRDVAGRHEVPILRNVEVARALRARSAPGDLVPREMFDIMATIIVWARQVQHEIRVERGLEPSACTARRTPPPGEDLTRYPVYRR